MNPFIETIEEFIYCFKGYEQLKNKTNIRNLFLYAISNLDTTNISRFYANDYINLIGITDARYGLTQLRQDLLSLARIDGVTHYSKKNLFSDNINFFSDNIIISVNLENKYVYIEFNNEFIKFIKYIEFDSELFF
jgi:hypothetical protein